MTPSAKRGVRRHENLIFLEDFDPLRHFYWVQLDFIQDLCFYNRLARKMLCRSGFWLLVKTIKKMALMIGRLATQ
jgi:hypothetical protein